MNATTTAPQGICGKLLTIQQGLKAPKDKYNTFGKFHYRSAESIIEALKPLLVKTKTVLLFEPQAVQVADHVRIEMTVSLVDTETQGPGNTIQARATVREDDKRAGMTASQNSGAAESFAKKYALGNLFAIDDTSDADSTAQPVPDASSAAPAPAPQSPRQTTPPAPAAKPQSARALGKQAWEVFSATAKAREMDKDTRSKAFLDLVQSTCGKAASTLTPDEWTGFVAHLRGQAQ